MDGPTILSLLLFAVVLYGSARLSEGLVRWLLRRKGRSTAPARRPGQGPAAGRE